MAVAVIYVSVAGPFWMLVKSNTRYLYLFMHIQQLRKKTLESVVDNGECAVQEILQKSLCQFAWIPSCLLRSRGDKSGGRCISPTCSKSAIVVYITKVGRLPASGH